MNIIRTALAFLLTTSVALGQTDSLDLKIGQMIMIGVPGTTVDPQILKEVEAGKVGSIIFFEKNIPPTNSFIAWKKVIWTYQKAAKVPLLMGIDQEGGTVNRMKEKYGFPKSLTADAIGKSRSFDTLQIYGEATASTLAGLGININFAPCVDLAINRANPIIAKYGRAYAADEDSVYLFARELVKIHRKHGILTTLKHFPGHGSSKSDTHKGIADVTDTWQERELKPYEWLIDSGYADGVMSTHIVHRGLDPEGYPGTMSNAILTGILRKRLGYDGVVFTDDMQMSAITKYYSLEEAIRLTINAGADILTFSNNISGSDNRTVDLVRQIIRQLINDGKISASRIDASYKRVMRLKQKLDINQDRQLLEAEVVKLRKELQQKEQIQQTPVKTTEEPAMPSKSKKKKRKSE